MASSVPHVDPTLGMDNEEEEHKGTIVVSMPPAGASVPGVDSSVDGSGGSGGSDASDRVSEGGVDTPLQRALVSSPSSLSMGSPIALDEALHQDGKVEEPPSFVKVGGLSIPAMRRSTTASSLTGPTPSTPAGSRVEDDHNLNLRDPPPVSFWQGIKHAVDHMVAGGDPRKLWKEKRLEEVYDLLAGAHKTKEEQDEPLLQDAGNTLAIVPFEKWLQPFWDMYKKAEASFWTLEELDLGQDTRDWEDMHPRERRFIENILGMFAGFDRLVNANLIESFTREVSHAPIQCFYGFQIAIENIHSEVYAILINTYIKDKARQAEIQNALEGMRTVKLMADWARHFTKPARASFGMRCVAFAAVEGIFFSASFCAIFWLKKRGLMPGLTFSNELISRDEGMHCDFGVLMYHHLVHKPDPAVVRKIVRSAVEIQKEFVDEALFCMLVGMNQELMKQYVEFCGDRLLVALDLEKEYHSVNPFNWMTLISLQGKTNFFEKRVSEYAKAGVGVDPKDQVFTLDADF